MNQEQHTYQLQSMHTASERASFLEYSNQDVCIDINRDELKIILQHMENGILVQGILGNLIYANNAAATLLGFDNFHIFLTYAKKNGRLFNSRQFAYTDILQKKISQKDLPWQTIIKSTRNTEELTLTITNKLSHESTVIHITSHLIYNKHLGIPIIMTTLKDISDTNKLEKQKDEFMSMASHELKTPITSMKVFTQMLQRNISSYKDPKPLYYLDKIEGQLNKMTLLVKELLDVSRLQTGNFILHKELFSLNEFIREVGQEIQYTTDKHIIHVKNTYHGSLYADKERLTQVLVNLLSNAIKYSPDNTPIHITSWKENQSVCIAIIDKGIGISKEYQKHIFDRFVRVSNNNQENTFPGMGVGLYIASQIVKHHNGMLTVKSKKNHGSTFTITLPTKQSNES